jgi:hypothetical protein
MKTPYDAMLEQYKKMQPPPGKFRVVAVDTFEMPGEQLYQVGDVDYDTREAALAAMAAWKKENPGATAYVYGQAAAKQ